HIYLVADTVEKVIPPLEDTRLTILQTPTPLHSKVAPAPYALTQMKGHHRHVGIFDADNLVPSHFLALLDRHHTLGYSAVQGKRIAKNMDSTYAALDAM